MERTIDTVLPGHRLINDGDMVLWRILPRPERQSLGPFVFIDHYRHRSKRGIGDTPHPHAGIEVLSYLLEGGMEHRDSMGFTDRLGPGDAQWIRAGRGMLHSEQPFGGRHGLQLWASLPSAQKLAEPAYAAIRSADIPEIAVAGVQVRIVAGRIDATDGPMILTSPTVFAHVRLDPGATVTLGVDAAAELGVYVLEGELETGAAAPLGPGAIAMLTSGDRVKLTAAEDGAVNLALLGGAPAEGPILFSGPFVMDTPERLLQAKQDFAAGRMGRLDGVPF
jgi:quercetin 2,3-dioxygenase